MADLIIFVILSILILISGWIPPLIIFWLSYRLSKQTLEKADQIRNEAVERAEAVKNEVILLTTQFKSRIDAVETEVGCTVGDLRGDLYRTNKEFKQTIEDLGAQNKYATADLNKKFDNSMKELREMALTEEKINDLKAGIRKSVTKAIDGKMGDYEKKLMKDIQNDPQMAAAYEQVTAQGAMPDLGNTVKMMFFNALMPK